MITSPIKIERSNNGPQADKVLELRGIGKQYPLAQQIDKDTRKSFSEFWALKDISLEAYSGQMLGLIGRNGSGKTTLLNVIAGVLTPTKGKIKIQGKVLGLFNLGVGFQDELTGRENIFLNGVLMGATKRELEEKLDAIVNFSELGNFINMPLGSYSQGMRLRLGFSIVANLDFDILLIDEILAVGDMLFQSKCFERLMDFRRAGKTLVITSQSIDLIKRLCDKVVLLNHGRLLFEGDSAEGVNRYQALLNSEKFFVGTCRKHLSLVRDTKKWVDSLQEWGQRLGTKEVAIEKVKLINRFGLPTDQVRPGDSLTIKVSFTARDPVKNPHFGVAIFREDGVYCYGPNTQFDQQHIPQLKKGKGYFILRYPRLLLASGNYRLSIAIWDNEEILAFDYHNGYYKFKITGANNKNKLTNIPIEPGPDNVLDCSPLNGKWGESLETTGIEPGPLKLFNHLGEEKDTFITNEPARFTVSFDSIPGDKNFYFWFGIYRSDGIYCQGSAYKINRNNNFQIFFPSLSLLPGDYRLSFGVWDKQAGRFCMYRHGIHKFNMVFDRLDHGTVYLEHKWSGNCLK